MSADKTVYVVEDDPTLRESLTFLLHALGLPVQSHESGRDLLDALPPYAQGCVLSDIRMPNMDGMELLRWVRTNQPQLPVILITGHGDVPLAVQAMKTGAADFIQKPFDHRLLIQSIKAALADAPDMSAPDGGTAGFAQRLRDLTARERQVFDRLVLGEANKVIARRLDISPRTVEIHRASIMTKLGAETLSDIIRLAVRAGLA
jgi:two-component system response regulator FixJ